MQELMKSSVLGLTSSLAITRRLINKSTRHRDSFLVNMGVSSEWIDRTVNDLISINFLFHSQQFFKLLVTSFVQHLAAVHYFGTVTCNTPHEKETRHHEKKKSINVLEMLGRSSTLIQEPKGKPVSEFHWMCCITFFAGPLFSRQTPGVNTHAFYQAWLPPLSAIRLFLIYQFSRNISPLLTGTLFMDDIMCLWRATRPYTLRPNFVLSIPGALSASHPFFKKEIIYQQPSDSFFLRTTTCYRCMKCVERWIHF